MLRGSLVTWATRVLRLRVDKSDPRYGGVTSIILNKQSGKTDKGWSSSFEVGKVAKNSSPIFLPLCSQFLEHRADFSVFWSFTGGRTPWTGDQLVARPLPKHRITQAEKNAHTHQTSFPWVGFETTIPAKTVHASDRWATVTATPHHKKKQFVTKYYTRFLTPMESWGKTKIRKMHMKFCTWNVRIVYRTVHWQHLHLQSIRQI
jgi:hypothetical protein